MYELKPNEVKTPVMLYTESSLIHGLVITRDIVRVPIFPRTESVPRYMHLINAQQIHPGDTVKTMKFDELFVPTTEVVGFHVAPNIEVELDYEESEANRHLVPVRALLGSFMLESKIRISMQTELDNSLEVTTTSWLSLYDGSITNPYLPQMNVKVPMLMVRPEKVAFGLIE
jgi:hypothetical protein